MSAHGCATVVLAVRLASLAEGGAVTVDDMIAVLDRHEAAENARDAEAAASTFVEDCYYVNAPLGARFEGRQGVMLNYLGVFTAFPDFSAERKLVRPGEDFLYEEVVIRGTFDGPFLHVEPTGKAMEVDASLYIPFRDGLMLAEHVHYDAGLMALQLGVDLETLGSLRDAMGP
jgi:hypothetical protein